MERKKIDPVEVLKKLLQNGRLLNAVTEAKLSKEQLIKAIPILIDMNEQDPEKDELLTSFYVSRNGNIKRQETLSDIGKEKAFINNIVTQSISKVSFDTDEFFKESGRKEVVTSFIPFLEDPDTYRKGLYIHGAMGIGKTFISKRFAKKLALKGKKVGIINLSTLSQKVKSSFSNGGYENIIEMLKNVEYLFLDDIGAESVSNWFRDEFLFSILNHRMDHRLTTFFTSNYSMKELEKVEAKTSGSKYLDYDKAKRLVERVKALSVENKLTGKNHR